MRYIQKKKKMHFGPMQKKPKILVVERVILTNDFILQIIFLRDLKLYEFNLL